MPVIQAIQEAESIGGLWPKAGPGKSARTYMKNTLKSKKDQVGAWLKPEALSSNPNAAKIRNKNVVSALVSFKMYCIF